MRPFGELRVEHLLSWVRQDGEKLLSEPFFSIAASASLLEWCTADQRVPNVGWVAWTEFNNLKARLQGGFQKVVVGVDIKRTGAFLCSKSFVVQKEGLYMDAQKHTL